MRLGREVDDRVGVRDRLGDLVGVLDAADDQPDVEPVEVLAPAGVGELVEHRDLVAVLGEALAHEVGADEAGSSADQQSHAVTSRRARWARSPSRHGGRTGASPRVVASTEKAGRGGGPAELGGALGLDAAVQPGLGERRDGELEPRAVAAAGDVQRAGQAALGHVDQRRRQVARVGRAADLVVDHGDLVALGAEPAHGVDEVAAVRSEQPRRAHDRGTTAGRRRRRARPRAWNARRPSAGAADRPPGTAPARCRRRRSRSRRARRARRPRRPRPPRGRRRRRSRQSPRPRRPRRRRRRSRRRS